MQVPEKLSLIGGSILLASTLVFTLKSQASSIIPHVGHSISNVFDHIGDAQKSSDFDSNFQQAQKRGWATGTWGSAQYYIDNDQNMHVGSGKLSGSLYDLSNAGYLKTINLDKPVEAPQDSDRLFGMYLGGVNHTLTNIRGLNNLDTSHVTNMDSMFCENQALKELDVSNFNTSQVTNMESMFGADGEISNLDVSHFDTAHVTNFGNIFMGNNSQKLDLSHWDTSHANNYIGISWTNGINQLILGPNTKLRGDDSWSSVYKNNDQILSARQLSDGQTHPGTWTMQ